MSYVGKESLGAQYRITTTRKPPRGLDAENAARRQLQPGETAHSHFATVGERGIIDEIRNASAIDIRADMEVRKHAPIRCEACLMPAHAHAIYGGEVDHMPVFRYEGDRVAGVTPGVELYDEADPHSPNHLARRPDLAAFQLALDENDPALAEAHQRWRRATRRHRPDPDNPVNWREVD